jgi:tRNA threonylcarbamoyl adenosine modification protein YeaZ
VIAAIDAASTDLSIALVSPDGTTVAEDGWTSDRRQSAELLPHLLALLGREGTSLGALSAIGVGTGPGSFTGLRVAMALAKGLAVALARPIVGVPSLASWLDADVTAEAAIARAGAREAFVLVRDAPDPIVVGAGEVSTRFADAQVVAPAELAESWRLARAARPAGARAIGAAAARRLASDPAGDPVGTLDPAYLRQPRGIAAAPREAAPWR